MAVQRDLMSAVWTTLLGFIFTVAKSQDQPASLTPPVGNVAVLSFVGKGVQQYRCSPSLQYEYEGAEAELFARKLKWGYHYFLPRPDAGGGKATFALLSLPNSTFNSSLAPSSTATFRIISSAMAKQPKKDISSLLLMATSHSGNGPFSMVSYAQRFNTKGGVAPSNSCDVEGAVVKIPYKAEYRFWSQTNIPPSTTPIKIMVPPREGSKKLYLIASFFGQGHQLYTFNGTSWVLTNASALLSSLPGNPIVGRHYYLGHKDVNGGQPTWEFFSPRGRVSAMLLQAEKWSTHDIPWILAQATTYVGELTFVSKVIYVQRLSTSGGLAPNSSVGAKFGDTYQSAYNAIYTFHGA